MNRQPKPQPVGPNTVYVWRGFRSANTTQDQFAQFLGSIFVPACALLQPPIGLHAYLTTMVPQADKPAGVPDQTALMFWATPTAHDLAANALAERIYQKLHGDVYDMARSKSQEVPVSLGTLTGPLQAEQPYSLLDRPADWMLGSAHHFVGARPAAGNPSDFLTAVGAWAAKLRQQPPAGMDGGLVCCGNDYVAAWLHGPGEELNLKPAFDELATLAQPVLCAAPQSLQLPAGLWDDWPGLDLTKDTCLNIQLVRPPLSEATPRTLQKP